MFVFASMLRIKNAVRMTIHDRGRERSPRIETSTLPQHFSRYGQQRIFRVALRADGVGEPVSRCIHRPNDIRIETSIRICEMPDFVFESEFECSLGFDQLCPGSLKTLARQ